MISPVVAQMPSNPQQLVQEGQTLYQQKNFTQAIPIWQKAVAGFAFQGDTLNQAMALSNLSLTYQQLGQWELANHTIIQSLNLIESEENNPIQQKFLAQILDVQGQLYWLTGHPDQAAETWDKAAKLYQQIGDQNRQFNSQVNQAKALQELGLYPRSCQTLLSTLSLNVQDCKIFSDLPLDNLKTTLEGLEKIPNTLLKFDSLHTLGNTLKVIGNLELSQKILEMSLTVAEDLNSTHEKSLALLSLGNLAKTFVERESLLSEALQDITILISRNQEALKYYQQAANLSTDYQLISQINILDLLLNHSQWLEPDVLTNYQNLWSIIQDQLAQLPPNRLSVYAQIDLAQTLLKLNPETTLSIELPSRDQILELLATTTHQAQLLGDIKAEVYGLGVQGNWYEQAEQLANAEKMTTQALSLVSGTQLSDVFYQYSWQLGRIQKAKSDQAQQQGNIQKSQEYLDQAIASYTNAFQTLQTLRTDLVAVNPEVQFTFRDSVEPVYRQLVDLNLQKSKFLLNTGKQGESQERLKQARNVIESLQLAELNNFFQDACVEVKTRKVDELDLKAVVIYPIILEDRLEVIYSLPGQGLLLSTPTITATNSPVTQKILETTLQELRSGQENASLESTVSGNNFLPFTQKLYDWLIRPAIAQIEASQAETLVFVLDGELRNIPMAVLHDGQKYLVEKYAICLTPGLQLLNPQPLSQSELIALIAGATNAPSFENNNLKPLPNIEQELSEISDIIPNNQRQENESFTQANLQTLINQVPFPVIHLATHGQFSSNAQKTFILDWNSQINVKDLDQLLQRPATEQPIELLVLSACETLAGDNRAALGLAGVAVRAGARSTVATLWQVSDKSTALLMSEFYQELANSKGSINKAEALRRAQVKLLKNSQYQHPFFWAPYVLVGNWQ